MFRKNGSAPGQDAFGTELTDLITEEYGKMNVRTRGNLIVISHMGMVMSVWFDDALISLNCDVLDPSDEPVKIPEDEVMDRIDMMTEMEINADLYRMPDGDGFGLRHSFIIIRNGLRDIESVLDIIYNLFFACYHTTSSWNQEMYGIDPSDPGYRSRW